MRVTNMMMMTKFMRNLSNNELRLNGYQDQLSTGHRINKPSDDPVGVIATMRYRSYIKEAEVFTDNINKARDFLSATDTALGNISDIIQRASELTIQGLNGTNSDASRQSIAQEIRQLAEQVGVVANTAHGSKYIFAGSNVTEPPFDPAGWRGNDQPLNLEIGVGVTMTVNSRLGDFFYNTDPASPGLYQLLNDIAADLENNDTAGLNSSLGLLQSSLDRLNNERATIGARINRLDLQEKRLEESSGNYTELLSKTQDCDMAEVIMNLKMQESVYRASLEAGARILLPTLADFLR